MPEKYSSIGPALKKLQENKEKKPPVNAHDVNKAAKLLTKVNNYSEATSKPSIELPEEIPLRPYSRSDFEPYKYIHAQLDEQFKDLDSPGFTNTSSTTITTNSSTSTTSSLDSNDPVIQSFKDLEWMPCDPKITGILKKLKEIKNNKGPVR